MLVPGKRLTVFSLKKNERSGATVWVRAGNAYVNKDGSMNIYLDVLPLNGTLHIRETQEKKDVIVVAPEAPQPPDAFASMEVAQ